MTEFVIRVDGELGELLVDGKKPELFGALVAVDVRRDVLRIPGDGLLSSSLVAADRPIVEVTLRLPLGPNDRLTVLHGSGITEVNGPSA
jgi:hypothetical protein